MRKRSKSAGINLTPLIDVLFVVLIAFIIVNPSTTPLLLVDNVNLASGISDSMEFLSQDGEGVIKVYVNKDDSISVFSKKFSLKDFEKFLEGQISKNPSVQLTLFHDKDARFGTFQNIKNVAERTGITKMTVALIS